mmetsp:Transcript_115479/g.326412  ORF Transcript_115479/g.326412 Transcript_115479/m.326412 type:complete len:280 (-) Transcript_115479:480-1319(-)
MEAAGIGTNNHDHEGHQQKPLRPLDAWFLDWDALASQLWSQSSMHWKFSCSPDFGEPLPSAIPVHVNEADERANNEQSVATIEVAGGSGEPARARQQLTLTQVCSGDRGVREIVAKEQRAHREARQTKAARRTSTALAATASAACHSLQLGVCAWAVVEPSVLVRVASKELDAVASVRKDCLGRVMPYLEEDAKRIFELTLGALHRVSILSTHYEAQSKFCKSHVRAALLPLWREMTLMDRARFWTWMWQHGCLPSGLKSSVIRSAWPLRPASRERTLW